MTDREHIKCLWLFLLGGTIGYLIVIALVLAIGVGAAKIVEAL